MLNEDYAKGMSMTKDASRKSYVYGPLMYDFFNKYLLSEKAASPKTADAYRYSLIAFGKFIEKQGIALDQIKFEDLTVEFFEEFLSDLEQMGNSIATRNQRQAALNSYFKYVANRLPELRAHFYQLTSQPLKKAAPKEISYVKAEGLAILLSIPDQSKLIGIRNLAMMVLMATIGLRVSELISIRLQDLNFETPCSISIHGKGSKERKVNLPDRVVSILSSYLRAADLSLDRNGSILLFSNEQGVKFCRQNINRMVEHYGKLAREYIAINNLDSALIPEKLTPHMLRHSAAMNLIALSSISLEQVQLMLGLESLQATEIYAKAYEASEQQARAAMDRVVSQFNLEAGSKTGEQEGDGESKQISALDRLRMLNFKDPEEVTDKIIGLSASNKRRKA